MIIGKEFRFDSAHKLENYSGKCGNLHGHTYILQVSIQGKVQENGLVLDLAELRNIVNKKIIDRLDHKYLNDLIHNPSIENVSIWIWEQLIEELPLHEVKLWETPTTFAIYSGK